MDSSEDEIVCKQVIQCLGALGTRQIVAQTIQTARYGTFNRTNLLWNKFAYAQFALDDHLIIEQYKESFVMYCFFHVILPNLLNY